MSSLVKYEIACRALAEAKSFDDVKDIRDKSIAMQEYARRAKNRQLEVDAAEIRIRAERRYGEMLNEMREAGLLLKGGRPKTGSTADPVNPIMSLPAMGVDKHMADRARKLAAVPKDEFEQTLADHRDEQAAVTARTMTRLAEKGETKQKAPKNAALDALLAAWRAADTATKRAFMVAIGAISDEGALDVWAWYSAAYLGRYGVDPVRNAKVNSQLAQLITRIGRDAPYVAQFYVGHNQRYYVEKGHPVGLLLADCEKLRTEWATNVKITATAARQADATQSQGDVWNKLLDESAHEA